MLCLNFSINVFCLHWENLSATIQNILTDSQLFPDSSSEILANKSKCAAFWQDNNFQHKTLDLENISPLFIFMEYLFPIWLDFFVSFSSRLSWFPCWQITHRSYKSLRFDAWIPAKRKIFFIGRIFWSTNTQIFFRKDQGYEWFFNKTVWLAV